MKLLIGVRIGECEVCGSGMHFRVSKLEAHSEIMFDGFVGWRVTDSISIQELLLSQRVVVLIIRFRVTTVPSSAFIELCDLRVLV